MNNTENSAYCRLCAHLKPHSELANLQTNEEMCHKIMVKLSRFNIVLDFQDLMPKTVCLICVKSLERAFTFVTAVEQAQTFLSDKLQTQNSDLCNENTPNKPASVTNEVIIDIKVENTRDPMELNDDSNIQSDNGVNCNVYNDNPGFNEASEEFNIEINHHTIPCDVIIDEMVKDESGEYSKNNDKNVDDDVQSKNNILKDILEKGHSSELIPPQDNTFSSSSYIIEQYTGILQSKNLDIAIKDVTVTWSDYQWKCSHCGTLFSKIDELQKHSMRYHNSCNPYQCTDCVSKRQSLNTFIRHVLEHRKYLHYSCYKCFKKFPHMNLAWRHNRIVHEASGYVCSGCNTPFSSKSQLDDHVSKYYNHKKTKPLDDHHNLTCNICNRTLGSVEAFRRHLDIHTDRKKEYVCDICGKCLLLKRSLVGHMLQHTDARPFKCEICKFTFKTSRRLQLHMPTHDGRKPFACDICGKCFRTKKYLVNYHMKIHTDSLPYTCTVCKKKFRVPRSLKHHMLQHTGEKPFSCNICSRGFTNLPNRNKHMRRRHGIEMAKKKQQILTNETSLATGEIEYPEADESNACEKKLKNKGRPRTKRSTEN